MSERKDAWGCFYDDVLSLLMARHNSHPRHQIVHDNDYFDYKAVVVELSKMLESFTHFKVGYEHWLPMKRDIKLDALCMGHAVTHDADIHGVAEHSVMCEDSKCGGPLKSNSETIEAVCNILENDLKMFLDWFKSNEKGGSRDSGDPLPHWFPNYEDDLEDIEGNDMWDEGVICHVNN